MYIMCPCCYKISGSFQSTAALNEEKWGKEDKATLLLLKIGTNSVCGKSTKNITS